MFANGLLKKYCLIGGLVFLLHFPISYLLLLFNFSPESVYITFILKTNITNAMNRLNKRKKKNRYDKFSNNFYKKVQNAFLKIAKLNKRKYIVVDNSFDSPKTEKIIFNEFIRAYKK